MQKQSSNSHQQMSKRTHISKMVQIFTCFQCHFICAPYWKICLLVTHFLRLLQLEADIASDCLNSFYNQCQHCQHCQQCQECLNRQKWRYFNIEKTASSIQISLIYDYFRNYCIVLFHCKLVFIFILGIVVVMISISSGDATDKIQGVFYTGPPLKVKVWKTQVR